jgi:chromosome segregation ATPase
MDMQQPANPQPGVVLSIDYNTTNSFTKLSLDQKLDATENNFATLLKNVPKKPTEIKTAEDLFASVEANSEIYRQRLNETAVLRDSLNTFEQRLKNAENLIVILDEDQTKFNNEQNTLKTSLQSLEQITNALHQKVDQTDSNQIELNTRIMGLSTQFEALKTLTDKLKAAEELQKLTNLSITELQHHYARLQSQVKCLGTFVIGLIAGFFIWIHTHKA